MSLNCLTLDSIMGTTGSSDSKVDHASIKHNDTAFGVLNNSLIELEKHLVSSNSIANMEQYTNQRQQWKNDVAAVDNTDQFKALLLQLIDRVPQNDMHPQWANKHELVWKRALTIVNSEAALARLLLSIEWMRFGTGTKTLAPSSWNSSDRKTWRKKLEELDENSLKKVREIMGKAFGFEDVRLDDAGAGHRCISEKDRTEATSEGSALLFGELLMAGVHRAFDAEHLNGYEATVIYDLGMGLGKMAMQAYLFFTNVTKVVGVELAASRFKLGQEAVRRLAKLFPETYTLVHDEPLSVSIVDRAGRTLEFRKQNLFECTDAVEADIVICETHIPRSTYPRLAQFLGTMKHGMRTLCFENLTNVYIADGISEAEMPLQPLHINVDREDRFKTTWSRDAGHHFYLYEKK
jgi:hypothetical protein